MKKYLIIPILLLFTCGGSEDSIDEIKSSSNNIETTTTIQDTTTTISDIITEDSTITTIQDTTTTTIIKNKCDISMPIVNLLNFSEISFMSINFQKKFTSAIRTKLFKICA